MGANKNEFIKIRMSQQDYAGLPESVRETMDIDKVEIDNIDYSDDELWMELRKASLKAYRKLKDREYELRHKYGYEPNTEEL